MEMLLAIGILNIVYLAMRSQKKELIQGIQKAKHYQTGIPMSELIDEQTIKRVTLVLNLVLNGLIWNVIWHLPETTALFTGIVWTIYWPAKHLRSYISMRKIVKQHEQSLKAYEELFEERP